MSEAASSVTLSLDAARTYQRELVPALFEPWAEILANRLELTQRCEALDVGCGTGVLARAMMRRGAAVTGLDPDPAMLAVASESSEPATWAEGEADSIPCSGGRFDAVGCQFALMFVADPGEALREMQRVLKPGGRLTVAVWDALDSCEANRRLVLLLEELFGNETAGRLRRPFSMGDRGALARLCTRSGIPARIDTLRGRVRFPSLHAWIDADARGWLQLDDDAFIRLMAVAEKELDEFVTEDGSVEFPIRAHVITARKR